MMHATRLSTSIILGLLCMGAAFSVSAQSFEANIPYLAQGQPLLMRMNPEEPRAGDTVRFSLESTAIDLERSTIVWYANDREVSRGDALKEITIVAGPLGSRTIVEAFVSEESGARGRARADVRPVEMSVVWDSNSYVPPFFKGRTLPSTSGEIRAYTIVRFQKSDGSLVSEKDIIYMWYKNGAKISSLSGRGKSGAVFVHSLRFSDDTIRVVAESVDTQFRGTKTFVIPRRETVLSLYENHPLFGVLYHRAFIGEVNTAEREQKVTAVPYFADVRSSKDGTLMYEWKVNDTLIITSESDPDTINIATNEYTGPAQIELSLMSSADILMRAIGSWRLLFGESSGVFFETNAFGQ